MPGGTTAETFPKNAWYAAGSIAIAAAIGIYGAVTRDPWIGAFVAAGVFIVLSLIHI